MHIYILINVIFHEKISYYNYINKEKYLLVLNFVGFF